VNAVVITLLAIACASVAVSAAGVLLSRNVYERLHFLAPAATVGVAAVALAILIREALGQAGIKAVIAALVLFVMNPILTHATARAARVQERGHWQEDEPQ
jgi:multicomponent Na+:H+ antiporter subunit G